MCYYNRKKKCNHSHREVEVVAYLVRGLRVLWKEGGTRDGSVLYLRIKSEDRETVILWEDGQNKRIQGEG